MKDPADRVTLELGFDGFAVSALEVSLLRGAGPTAVALYMLCLKGRTDPVDGFVAGVTWGELVRQLAPRDTRRSGPKTFAPSLRQVQAALEQLQAVGLVVVDRKASQRAQRLCIGMAFP